MNEASGYGYASYDSGNSSRRQSLNKAPRAAAAERAVPAPTGSSLRAASGWSGRRAGGPGMSAPLNAIDRRWLAISDPQRVSRDSPAT